MRMDGGEELGDNCWKPGWSKKRERERETGEDKRNTQRQKGMGMAWRLSQKVPAEILALRAKEEELDSYT